MAEWNTFRKRNIKLGDDTTVRRWRICTNKTVSWDIIRVSYGWKLNRLPDKCAFGGNLNLQHALSCKTGEFISIWHYQIRNITASLQREICKDITVKPTLQQFTCEKLNRRSANMKDGARLDVCAKSYQIW